MGKSYYQKIRQRARQNIVRNKDHVSPKIAYNYSGRWPAGSGKIISSTPTSFQDTLRYYTEPVIEPIQEEVAEEPTHEEEIVKPSQPESTSEKVREQVKPNPKPKPKPKVDVPEEYWDDVVVGDDGSIYFDGGDYSDEDLINAFLDLPKLPEQKYNPIPKTDSTSNPINPNPKGATITDTESWAAPSHRTQLAIKGYKYPSSTIRMIKINDVSLIPKIKSKLHKRKEKTNAILFDKQYFKPGTALNDTTWVTFKNGGASTERYTSWYSNENIPEGAYYYKGWNYNDPVLIPIKSNLVLAPGESMIKLTHPNDLEHFDLVEVPTYDYYAEKKKIEEEKARQKAARSQRTQQPQQSESTLGNFFNNLFR